MQNIDLELLDRIKRLAILAMISDDDLMELLIFKGGSAIDIFYGGQTSRASIDLDYSMENSLTDDNEKIVADKIKKAIEGTFKESKFYAFDIKFEKRPRNLIDKVKDFWGGYQILFKVISNEKILELEGDKNAIRRNAFPLGKKNSTQFRIDISSHEYCKTKTIKDFEDYTIYVYTPEMIVFEKLRAICQQIPEYQSTVQTNRKPRGRDFYDIELLTEKFNIDPHLIENIELIRNIFDIKKVPLSFIQKIKEQREFHRENFESSLKTTLSNTKNLKDFDYYFDYVLAKFKSIIF